MVLILRTITARETTLMPTPIFVTPRRLSPADIPGLDSCPVCGGDLSQGHEAYSVASTQLVSEEGFRTVWETMKRQDGWARIVGHTDTQVVDADDLSIVALLGPTLHRDRIGIVALWHEVAFMRITPIKSWEIGQGDWNGWLRTVQERGGG